MDVILNREELYRDVWSKGISMVARKYDLSEGDIRKACFALDVPRPARGYWGKLKTGDAPPVPPLPPSGASTYVCTTVKRKPTPGKGPAPKKPAKENESLVEWVLKNRAEMQLQKAVQTPAPPHGSMHLLPEDMIGLPRYLPLTFWAALLLGEHAPHYNTLLRWVRDGRIYPRPIKVGGAWNVRKDAAYMPD
jgi:hypothetical protein